MAVEHEHGDIDQRQHYRADGIPKVGFDYIDEARQASASHYAEGEIVMPYKCAVCGRWHLGHEPRGRARRYARRRAEGRW